MQPKEGCNELREQGRMTWIEQEHGRDHGQAAVGAPAVTGEYDRGDPTRERDPYQDEGGEG